MRFYPDPSYVVYHRVCGHIVDVSFTHAHAEQRRWLLVAAGYYQWQVRTESNLDSKTLIAWFRQRYRCQTCRIDPTRAKLPWLRRRRGVARQLRRWR